MKKLSTLAVAALLATTFGSAAMAQSVAPTAPAAPAATEVPGHPRINEVDQRLNNQQQRIDNGVNSGQINAQQEERDQTRDSKVSQELSADEAKNGGHVTKAEQHRMNRQLNKTSGHIHHQRKNGATPASAPAAAPAPAAQ